tara:strand:+ start:1515 stop:3041 length:1527 start_codon:yes stop_codon:yes gene_type:complete
MLYKPILIKNIFLLSIFIFSFELSIGQFTYAYGSYSGNGSNTSLTGIGFSPDAIMIKSEGAYEAIFSTGDMPSGYSKRMATSATALVTNQIVSLDSDGFTVGDQDETNKDGETYHWMAFKSEGDIHIGTYSGNSHGGQNISTPGFNPEMTWICGDEAHITADMIICLSSNADDCDYLNSGTKNTNKIHRDGSGFDTDGVSNQSPDRGSTNYYYMCFNNGASSNLKAGGWNNGGSVDNKHITGPGFEPDFVFVTTYVDGAGAPMFRPGSLSGDASFSFTAQAVMSNGIQSFSSSGFKIGTRNRVQDPWNAHDYAAMNGGINPTLALPVDLSEFEVNLEDDKKVRIEWTTKSEVNNQNFAIERSTDGENFEVIEDIEGAGNSFEEINYMTYDLNPPKGIVYYRISQTDFDGKNETFSTKVVFIGEGKPISWSYLESEKNPKILLQGNLEQNYTIQLYSIHGSIVFNKNYLVVENNTSSINFDLPQNLKKGIYLIKIDSEFYQSSGKIIIK